MITTKGLTSKSLDTETIVTMQGLGVTAVHLVISGSVDRITSD